MNRKLAWKRSLLVSSALAAAVIAPQAWGAACVNDGTVASYEALGATGCTIGDQTYSNFNFGSTASGAGTAATASEIIVLTDTTAGNEGVTFSTSALSLPYTAGTVDVTITFDVTTAEPEITDASLTIAGTVGNPDAGDYISVSETLTPAGDATVSLNETLPPNADNVGEVDFNATDEVSVLKDAGVFSYTCDSDCSDDGSNLSAFTENFSETTTVPEPATLALLGSGLVAFGVTRRRRRKVT